MLKYLLATLLCCSTAFADDPPKPVDPVPVTPPVVVPVIPPVTIPPKPPEKITISVPKGVLGDGKRLSPYVFDSSTKCYLTVNTTSDKLTWDLEDGPPDAEKIGTTNNLIGFSLANPGLYQVYAQWETGFSKIWFEIKGSGPAPPVINPPVIPDPINPGPTPDPNVTPVSDSGFRVMMIYDKTVPMTRDQMVILNSTKIRDYLSSKCIKSGTQPDWRVWDKNVTVSTKESPSIQAMWTGLKPSLGALPQIAIHENGKGHVFPLPATEDLTLTLLKKYGGN